MSYFINPVEADQCIFLEYEGTVPPRQVIAARDSAAGLLAARRWNRIVADITEIRTLPLTREFFILYVLVRGLARKIPPSARVALVIRPEQELQARFIESVARKDGVPAYVVLNDKELVGIAERNPATLAELGRCRGMGPIRLERWGDEILAVLQDADTDR